MSTAPYDRSDWPHWVDTDRDCQDTRDEVLIAEAVTAVTLSVSGCDVIAGAWIDHFTGQRVTDPSQLDIDHMVPLANANASGGAGWSTDHKRRFANDRLDPSQGPLGPLGDTSRETGASGDAEHLLNRSTNPNPSLPSVMLALG